MAKAAKPGSKVPECGDVLVATKDSLGHYYSAASGPDCWNFVYEGETFLAIKVYSDYRFDDTYAPKKWQTVLALSGDGEMVVLSFPKDHNFRII